MVEDGEQIVQLSEEHCINALIQLKALKKILYSNKESEGLADGVSMVESFLVLLWLHYSVSGHKIEELEKRNLALGSFMGLR